MWDVYVTSEMERQRRKDLLRAAERGWWSDGRRSGPSRPARLLSALSRRLTHLHPPRAAAERPGAGRCAGSPC
ncbi:MAG TPA: hypothetical protein VIC59_07910 [Gemmatimonadota bacterium]|jgi:hypothetical protein